MQKDVWYIGGRQNRRRQKGGFLPVGGLATPILGSLGGVVIKEIFGGKRYRS